MNSNKFKAITTTREAIASLRRKLTFQQNRLFALQENYIVYAGLSCGFNHNKGRYAINDRCVQCQAEQRKKRKG